MYRVGQCNTCLQRASIRPNDPLPPLDITLLIPHGVSNLDDVTRNRIVENLHGLSNSNTTRQQFDHVASLEDDIWVVCFSGRAYSHGTMNKIECARDALHVHVNKH